MRPPHHRTTRGHLIAALLLVALVRPRVAAATEHGEREECFASAERAQDLQAERKFRAARASLNGCTKDTCPAVVRSDCIKWLSSVEAATPTIVVRATDAGGRDVTNVRVLVDGETLAAKLEGQAFGVDPGEHVIRYERWDGLAIEERVVFNTGEKNRLLRVTFAARDASARALPASEPVPSRTATRIVGGALLGLGALGVGSFAFFGLSGKSDEATLNGCSPRCDPRETDAIRAKYLVADVSLLAGIVAAGVGLYLILTAGAHPPTSARMFDVRTNPLGI